jgi:hypothetical protein
MGFPKKKGIKRTIPCIIAINTISLINNIEITGYLHAEELNHTLSTPYKNKLKNEVSLM